MRRAGQAAPLDGLLRVVRGVLAGDASEHDTLQEAVSAESVVAMDAAGDLGGGVQPRQDVPRGVAPTLAVAVHLRVGVDAQPAHAVVQRRRDVRDEEVVVVVEDDREGRLAEDVASAGGGGGAVQSERLAQHCHVHAQNRRRRPQAARLLNQLLVDVEAGGGRAEPVDDGLRQQHGGGDRHARRPVQRTTLGEDTRRDVVAPAQLVDEAVAGGIDEDRPTSAQRLGREELGVERRVGRLDEARRVHLHLVHVDEGEVVGASRLDHVARRPLAVGRRQTRELRHVLVKQRVARVVVGVAARREDHDSRQRAVVAVLVDVM